jgi:hypothetical protein
MPDATSNTRILLELARARARLLYVEGIEWRVYELPAGLYDRRDSPSLVFEASDAFRRIRGFPTNWRELSDEALYAVSLKP